MWPDMRVRKDNQAEAVQVGARVLAGVYRMFDVSRYSRGGASNRCVCMATAHAVSLHHL